MPTPPPSPVASPCIRECCLDENDICLGCYRSISEITGWTKADDREKEQILLRCGAREQERKVRFNLD